MKENTKKIVIRILNIFVILANLTSIMSLVLLKYLAPLLEKMSSSNNFADVQGMQEMVQMLENADIKLVPQIIIISICIIFSILCLIFSKQITKNKEKIVLCSIIPMMIGSIYNIIAGVVAVIIMYKKPKGEKEDIKLPILKEIKVTWVSRIIYIVLFVFVFVLSYTNLFVGVISKINPIIAIITLYVVHILVSILPFIKNLKRDIKAFIDNRKVYFKEIVKTFAIALLCYLPIALILSLTLGQSTNQNTINELPMWFTVIIGVIIAPICEEIIFRGFIRKIIKNDIVFIIISSLIFGIIHCMYVEENWLMYLHVIPYAVLGGAFAKIYAKTDNILTNISIHFIWNLIVFVSMFLLGI